MRSLSVIAAVVLLGTVVAVSFAALGAFDREVRPAIEREAAVIGVVVANPFERALGLGIPFDELVGAREYLEDMAASQPAVAYLVLTDLAGQPRATAGPSAASFQAPDVRWRCPMTACCDRALPGIYETAVPVAAPGGRPQGWLLVGVSRAAVDAIIDDTRWDLVIVLLVAVMLAMELLRFVIDRTVIGPLSMIERMARRLGAGDCTALADTGATDEAGAVARARECAGAAAGRPLGVSRMAGGRGGIGGWPRRRGKPPRCWRACATSCASASGGAAPEAGAGQRQRGAAAALPLRRRRAALDLLHPAAGAGPGARRADASCRPTCWRRCRSPPSSRPSRWPRPMAAG